MGVPLIAAAMGLAELVPAMTRWFSKDDAKVGHANRIATKMVDVAKTLTGCQDGQSALRALEKDPQLLIQYQQEMLRYDRELESAFLQDRQDARARDMAFISSGRRNRRADIMVVSAALGLLACLMALAYFREALPGETVGIISTIAGIFGSCLKDAYAFEFGSSRGSKEKDAAVLFSVAKSER